VEGDRDAEAVLRLLGAAALAIVLAGCGSGSTGLAASCERQQSELDRIGAVRNVGEAQTAIRQVIAIERRGLADLRDAQGPQATVSAYERALADARRLELSLGAADPTQTMSPLQIGPSAGRRTVERARLLVRRLCDSLGARAAVAEPVQALGDELR
jgi:hypothetical protein